jgi:hypothetical protein
VSRAPVLIAIDDVQWVDASTKAILEFGLRRLTDAPIRILLARRDGPGTDRVSFGGDLPVQRVGIGPLSADELGRLIASRVEAPLIRPRLAELHQTSGGNPYFALEIVRMLEGRHASIDPGEPLPVPEDVAALLRARIAGLSAPSLEALLLTAASPQPTASAIAAITRSAAGIAEAMAAGILEEQDGRLRFAHPLLASVVYGGAGAAARREVHRRLAAVADPDDRALHLARATAEPDAAIAAELDAAAARAYRRGAPAAAAELEEHACRLTPIDLEEQSLVRSERSAEYHLAAGDTACGRALLERLLDQRAPGPARARVALRLGCVRYTSDDVAAAHKLFVTPSHRVPTMVV